MAHSVSPLAPRAYVSPAPIAGVRFATAEAGIKYKNRTDVLLAVFDPGTAVAGVLTRSKCPSAPVEWCRELLGGGAARALLVNSGNANAFTGRKGRETVSISAGFVAEAAGCAPDEIFLASTGVIGEPLDPEKFRGVVGDIATRLVDGPWMDAARAIMTTDTFPKLAGSTLDIDGTTISISGIAKGSGTTVTQVNQLMERFAAAQKMMRQMGKGGGMPGMGGQPGGAPGMGGMPGMGGLPGAPGGRGPSRKKKGKKGKAAGKSGNPAKRAEQEKLAQLKREGKEPTPTGSAFGNLGLDKDEDIDLSKLPKGFGGIFGKD